MQKATDVKGEVDKQIALLDHFLGQAIAGIADKAVTAAMRDLQNMQLILESHANVAGALASCMLGVRNNVVADILEGCKAELAKFPPRTN